MENKRRMPIRRKVMVMVLIIAIAALVFMGIIGTWSIRSIQGKSEGALISQMEQNLTNIVVSKAELADSSLGAYADIVNDFAIFINGLYKNPDDYPRVHISHPNAEDGGKFALQILPASEDMDEESYEDEASLLGNAARMIYPVISSSEDIITTVYIGSNNGFLIGYDKTSDMKADFTSYDFFNTVWYKTASRTQEVCFTDVYMDGFGRGLTITCAAPYYDENDEFFSYLPVKFTAEYTFTLSEQGLELISTRDDVADFLLAGRSGLLSIHFDFGVDLVGLDEVGLTVLREIIVILVHIGELDEIGRDRRNVITGLLRLDFLPVCNF